MKPYQPPLTSGRNLPAKRFVVFADDDAGQVWHINEAANTIEGYWESPDLVRLKGTSDKYNPLPGAWTLHKILLHYICNEDTYVTVSFSTNGGEIWKNERTVRLDQTRGGTQVKLVHANVTGLDVRMRILFPANELVKIVGYRPAMSFKGMQTRVGR